MHPSAAAGLRQDFLNDTIGEILLTAESHRSYHLKNLDAAQPRQKDAWEGHIQQNQKCIQKYTSALKLCSGRPEHNLRGRVHFEMMQKYTSAPKLCSGRPEHNLR